MPEAPEPRDLAHETSPEDSVRRGPPGARPGVDAVAAQHARELLAACEWPVESPGDRSTRDAHTPSPAVAWAASGAMALTGPADGPPRFAAGPLASAARGVALALETVSPNTPLGSLDAPALLGERAAIFGLSRDGARSAGGAARLCSARDGTLAINLPRDTDWELIPAWLEVDFDAKAPRDAAWTVLERGVQDRSAEALVSRGRLMGLAVANAGPAPDTRPQAVSRGRPAFFERTHESQTPIPAAPRRPRVLDLSALWAGPLATSLLVDAGCDVLKVEHPGRPDGAREGPTEFFDLMNGRKHGVALDLRATPDRQLFEALLEQADIVVDSARPRALAQLGYDASGWVTERPGRLWASITGYGRAHEWIAFGDDAAIDAGLAWAPEDPGGSPCFCGDAIADPIGGLHTAAIVLAHHARGLGGLLDLSLSALTRRSATLPCAGLSLPIVDAGRDIPEAERFCIVDDGRRVPVAAPRARAAAGSAPTLATPAEKNFVGWPTRPC